MEKALNKKRKFISPNENYSYSQKTKGRTAGFGLKEISSRVKEIIKRVGTTSYKEISDEIVNEINEKNSKDEKNIRRRIYDSLNVMKSIKLFKKDKSSKKIVSNLIDDKNTLQYNNIYEDINSNEINLKNEKLNKINKEIEAKRTKLTILKKELDSLNTVLERNKKFNSELEESKKIYFPFIIIEFPENLNPNDSRIKVSMNENKTQAHFAFDAANKLYGDLDAILKIGSNINLVSNNNNN